MPSDYAEENEYISSGNHYYNNGVDITLLSVITKENTEPKFVVVHRTPNEDLLVVMRQWRWACASRGQLWFTLG